MVRPMAFAERHCCVWCEKTPGCAVAGSESAVMAVRIGSGCVLGSL